MNEDRAPTEAAGLVSRRKKLWVEEREFKQKSTNKRREVKGNHWIFQLFAHESDLK